MIRVVVLFCFCAGVLLLPGCKELPCNKSVSQAQLDAVDQTQLQADIATIDAYLQSEGITAVADPSGIRYVVEEDGFGGTPCLENMVSVIYTGRLLSTGKEFDSGASEFELKSLILGWQIILTQYPKGTKLTLYIPSGYAYGTAGSGTRIPANAILVFDIEIINIR
ncbi:MAG: FKBP-type peptidyl-prolyl cis-trans isomerase [Bacteroidota bacterium]